MRAHMVGLGKLGLPVALTLEQAGHQITGWDVSPARRQQILARCAPEAGHEDHLAEYLAQSRMRLHRLVPSDTEIVLVAVQTPHKPQFEGCTPLDRDPEDFDYTALREAVQGVTSDIRLAGTDPLVVVISTCLPGTFDRELRPLVKESNRALPGRLGEIAYLPPVRVAYHPLFIAMGSVISDYRNPEFVLVGTDDKRIPRELLTLYMPLYGTRNSQVPLRCMSITSAELTKVAYNAWLGYKLMLANGIAETCDRVGANCDDVMGTLKVANRRLVSTAYMTPGMGDGGGCHPRDQIALSWLAKTAGLSYDPYGVVIEARERHAEWLADLWIDEAESSGLSPIMLGSAYKPNSPLQTGSHAHLVAHYASRRARVQVWDTVEDYRRAVPEGCIPPAACFFLATPHEWILNGRPEGVMIDPWGIWPDPAPEVQARGFCPAPALRVVRPGRRA